MLGMLRAAGAKLDPARGELRRASEALGRAKKEEAELQGQLDKLTAVIADAASADAAFQKKIAEDADVALALAEFADGGALEGSTAKIVERAQMTATAAVAARAALPKLQARLKELGEQIKSLEYDKRQALIGYLAGRASGTFQRYQRPWDELCRAYDQIVGIRRALEYGSRIDPIQGPLFSDGQPLSVKYSGDGESARRTQAKWREARARLDADPDAAIDDLIGAQPDSDAAYLR